MSDRDLAREIAPCRCEPCWTDRDRHAPDCLWDNCGEEIVDALAAARREERERCAQVAEVFGFAWNRKQSDHIAAAIRDLIEAEASKDGGTDRRPEGASGGTQSTPPTVPPSMRGVESPEAARPGAGSVATAQTTTDASTDSPAASPPPEPERCPGCGLIPGYPYPPWEQKDCDHQPPTGGKE